MQHPRSQRLPELDLVVLGAPGEQAGSSQRKFRRFGCQARAREHRGADDRACWMRSRPPRGSLSGCGALLNAAIVDNCPAVASKAPVRSATVEPVVVEHAGFERFELTVRL